MFAINSKSKISTSSIVFLYACLFCKISTTKADNFKLIRIELT